MAGIFSRSQYDECYFDQRNLSNINEYSYSMNVDSYVNPNFNKNVKSNTCDLHGQNVNNCSICNANKDAGLLQSPDNFAKRTEIENNLFGIERPLSLCGTQKYTGCAIKSSVASECDNVIAANPYLCERDIVPTNLYPVKK